VKRLDAEDKILKKQLKTIKNQNNQNNTAINPKDNDINKPNFNNVLINLKNLQNYSEENSENEFPNENHPSDGIKDSAIDEDINLIDLIFEYIKISKFEKNSAYNNERLLH